MGNIFSRFKSLESTKETLARIHSEIEEIEDYKWITLRNQNHIIGLYIFGLAIVCAIMILTLYFYYIQRLKNRGLIAFVLYITSFPILAYFLKNFLKSYYQHKLAVQEDRMHELKRIKRKILNEVMDKETYKIAKELIETYDPSMLRDKNFASPSPLELPSRMNQSMNSSMLRQRLPPSANLMNRSAMPAFSSTGPNQRPPMTLMGTPQQAITKLAIQPSASQMKLPPPSRPPATVAAQSLNRPQQFNPALIHTPLHHRPANMVRPICSQDRSIVEKMVDYLVGDGPNNRYGLICKFCYSHNGMALKDEFDYLNFRCCYCGNLNLARKQKPLAPTLVSYENAKENLADETLNESIKAFNLNDDSASSKDNANNSQIEEIENKLSDTKLNEMETQSALNDSDNDEMQVDDEISKVDILSSALVGLSTNGQDDEVSNRDNIESSEELKQHLDDLKLNE